MRFLLTFTADDNTPPSPEKMAALAMAQGPAAGLALLDRLTAEPMLKSYHRLPSARADLLAKLGRLDEARAEFERAASLTGNSRERALRADRSSCPRRIDGEPGSDGPAGQGFEVRGRKRHERIPHSSSASRHCDQLTLKICRPASRACSPLVWTT
jgi:hypothetical protein